MLKEEAREIGAPLERIVKISKLVSNILKVLIVLFLLVLVVAIVFVIATLFGLLQGFIVDISALVPLAIYSGATLILLKIMQDVFEDIAKGSSPFTSMQVKRLRFAALILFIGALVETLFSGSAFSIVQNCDMNISYHDSSISGNALKINAGSLIGAAFLFTSYVFEYGALLQEFTDDTL